MFLRAYITLLTSWIVIVTMPQVIAQLDPQKFTAIENFLTETMECRDIPGLQIALVTSDEVLMAKGYGLSNIEKGTPMTENTVTPIRSVSKTMFSTLVAAVMYELSQNGVDLDTRIQSILGEEFNTSDPVITEYVSIKDFLTMKSGCSFPEVLIESFQAMSPDEFLRNLKYYKCQLGQFRVGNHDSTSGYLILSMVLEKLTGKSFYELMHEYILDPLEMTDSDVLSKVTNIDDLAHSYTTDGESDIEVTPEYISQSGYTLGGAGMASNAKDMAKYLQMHLNNGKNQAGQQIIDESWLEVTKGYWNIFGLEPYTLSRPSFPHGFISGTYGFGWIKGYQKGYTMVHQQGEFAYYRTHVVIWPDLDLALFLTSNGRQYVDQRDAMTANMIYILDVLNGDVPWLNTTTGCSFPEPWQTTDEELPEPIPTDLKAEFPLKKYVGYYGQPGYGCFQVTLSKILWEINSGKKKKVLGMKYGKTGEFDLYATGNGNEFWRKGRGLQAWRWSKQDWYYVNPTPRTCEFSVEPVSGKVSGASCKFESNYDILLSRCPESVPPSSPCYKQLAFSRLRTRNLIGCRNTATEIMYTSSAHNKIT